MRGGSGGRGRGRGDGARCATAGCSNKAQASGRCRTHTGIGQCTQPGCEKQAQYKGLCVAHGGRRICTEPGCNKTVTSKGKCGDHGGGRRRSHSGTRKAARTDSEPKEEAPTLAGVMPSTEPSQASMMSLLLNEWPQEVAPRSNYQEVKPSNYQPQFGAMMPTWEVKESGTVLPVPAAVVPTTESQGLGSGGSMMSLLMEGWPGSMPVKVEDSRPEPDNREGNVLQAGAERTKNPRKRALCTHEGCAKIAQSQGLCVGHGGKRCLHEGCTKSAQYQGLCTTHGGSRTCTFPGCSKTIRSAGKCFEHGGGRQCSQPDCNKQAQTNGLCSTHRKQDGYQLTMDGGVVL
jgi:hypothetical protein